MSVLQNRKDENSNFTGLHVCVCVCVCARTKMVGGSTSRRSTVALALVLATMGEIVVAGGGLQAEEEEVVTRFAEFHQPLLICLPWARPQAPP